MKKFAREGMEFGAVLGFSYFALELMHRAPAESKQDMANVTAIVLLIIALIYTQRGHNDGTLDD